MTDEESVDARVVSQRRDHESGSRQQKVAIRSALEVRAFSPFTSSFGIPCSTFDIAASRPSTLLSVQSDKIQQSRRAPREQPATDFHPAAKFGCGRRQR